jgi:hypothetical protein
MRRKIVANYDSTRSSKLYIQRNSKMHVHVEICTNATSQLLSNSNFVSFLIKIKTIFNLHTRTRSDIFYEHNNKQTLYRLELTG